MLNRSTFGGYITEDGRFAFLGGRKARCQSPETILKVGISMACLRAFVVVPLLIAEGSGGVRCWPPILDASVSMSPAIFWSVILAYSWVVLMLVCPSIFETLSMGTSFSRVTVVAKVCRTTEIVIVST